MKEKISCVLTDGLYFFFYIEFIT